ncbi:protease 2 [Tanacetum coccineum]
MEKPSSASSEICGLSPLKMNVRDRDPLEEEETIEGVIQLTPRWIWKLSISMPSGVDLDTPHSLKQTDEVVINQDMHMKSYQKFHMIIDISHALCKDNDFFKLCVRDLNFSTLCSKPQADWVCNVALAKGGQALLFIVTDHNKKPYRLVFLKEFMSREVNPVPISLLSGFPINLCLKLAIQERGKQVCGIISGGRVIITPPAYDSETEDVAESEDVVEPEGETVPNSVHAVGESSTATFPKSIMSLILSKISLDWELAAAPTFSFATDFGGGHPDPNLTYAKELVSRMGLGKNPDSNALEFSVAEDGDADNFVTDGNESLPIYMLQWPYRIAVPISGACVDDVNFNQMTDPKVAKLFHIDSDAKHPPLVLLKKDAE